MRRNKYGLRLLVLGAFALLSACSESQGTANATPSTPDVTPRRSETVPETQAEVRQWLDNELQKSRRETHAQLNVDGRLSEQLQNPDRRLIRAVDVPNSSSQAVFMAFNKGSVAKTAPDEANHRLKERLNRTANRLLDDLDKMSEANRTNFASQPLADTALELNQADAQQMHYLGLMTVGTEQFGLIRVGERVYRVTPNMRIGRGQWRVVRLDATTMQVLINGQTVHYGK